VVLGDARDGEAVRTSLAMRGLEIETEANENVWKSLTFAPLLCRHALL
jgi:hypothetical protein